MNLQVVDLGKAFDGILANEEWLRFQRIAIKILRQTWPELIASEPKNDLGADGYLPISIAPDRVGRVLACSLTPSYAKILADAQKVKRNFPNTRTLLFATPASVSNQLQKSWQEALQNVTGLELVVLSREDLISRLGSAENAAILESEFGLNQPGTVPISALLAKIRTASTENVANWYANRRMQSFPLIELRLARLDSRGHYGEPSTIEEIAQSLLRHRRIVLEAPSGRGKTVTLIKLAESLLRLGALPFLIHLPQWAVSDAEICDFITNHLPAFSREEISSADLNRIAHGTPSVLLLNGWNEVPSALLEKMEQRLCGVDRDFSHLGVIVATRTRSLSPPLQQFEKIGIRRLAPDQRRRYLIDALGNDGTQFANELDRDHALDDLTRSPFVLHWTMRLRKAKRALPSTRMDILVEVTRLYEDEGDHRNAIRKAPLEGQAIQYLIALARHMTSHGQTTISEASARSACKAVRDGLILSALINEEHKIGDLLAALCDHHLLRQLSETDGAYEFEHQQFQEFYSALSVEQEFTTALTDPQLHTEYITKYIDVPAWEEAFRMLSESLGAKPLTPDSSVRANLLIEMAMRVDLIFAASLVFPIRHHLSPYVRSRFTASVKDWYALGEENHKICALAAMFASGLSDFTDLVLGLCKSLDQQVRLNTYRSAKEVHLEIFGDDWKQTVSGWEDPVRGDFISELTIHLGILGVAEYFAANDPSMLIRKESIQYLAWMGARGAVLAALAGLPDEEMDDALLRLYREDIPDELLERSFTALRRRASHEQNPVQKLQILLSQLEQGNSYAEGLIKEVLNAADGQCPQSIGHETLGRAIRALQSMDETWANEWLSKQIVGGTLDGVKWAWLLTETPEALRDEEFLRVSTEDLKHQQGRHLALLLARPDVSIARATFNRYLSVCGDLKEAKPPHTDARWAIRHQLEELFRGMPAAMVVEALDEHLTDTIEDHTLRCIAALLNGVGRFESIESRPLDMRPELNLVASEKLRQYLKRAAIYALSLNELDGELVAYVSSALARVGSVAEQPDLELLIKADIARWDALDEAASKGHRVPRRGWCMWHVRALTTVAGDGADQFLMSLLTNCEYGELAAKALEELARISSGLAARPNSLKIYEQFWKARAQGASELYERSKQERYAAALKTAVAELMENSPRNAYLLQKLAAVLAVIDGPASADIVYDVVQLPLESNGWSRLEALRALTASGVAVPLSVVSKVLNDVLQDVRPKGYFNGDQDRDLVIGLVKLLPYSDDPAAGVSRLEDMFSSRVLRPYEFRRMVPALGASGRSEAMDLLLQHLNTDSSGFKQGESEWVEAVARLGGEKAIAVLFRFIDPDENALALGGTYHSHIYDLIARKIAGFAANNDTVQQRLYLVAQKNLSEWQKYSLMQVFAILGTPESLLAGVSLYRAGASTRIPRPIVDAFEKQVLDRLPHGSSNSYSLEKKPAASLRKALFERLFVTPQLKWPVFALLGQIEVWRLTHGRPIDEPRHPSLASGYRWPPSQFMAK